MTSALVASGFALVGNLATSTVDVDWWWWPWVTWGTAGALLAAGVTVEVVRSRSDVDSDGEAVDSSGRVFGAIPQPAWHWQDRPDEATELRRALGRKGRAALVALPGQRGVGKSQLAAAYARKCVADGYDLVAWINAESGVTTELALLAEHLGLGGGADSTPETLAAAVRRWLERDDRGVRRLVVFDNVDDPDSLSTCLPSTGTTKVLITTNRQEFATMPGVTPVKVEMFTVEEGLAFLRKATSLPESDDVVRLGEALGWLPLGLAQAAALIAHEKLPYRQYLTRLDGESLDDALVRLGTDHPGVLKAAQLSLTALRREDRSGDAARLLTVLSLLSPDGVSRAVLTQVESAAGLKGGLGRALRTLATASLITLAGPEGDQDSGDGVVVSVHRLTARVIRHHAGKPPASGLAVAIDTAIRILGAVTDAFPAAQVTHRRREVDELVAHILTLRGYAGDTPPPGLLDRCNWAGRALREVGDLVRAIQIYEATLADRVRVLSSDHPDTLRSRNNLAYAYESAGRVDEAVGLFEAVLGDCERVLGSDHPDTLMSRNNLAYTYESAGRVDEAVGLFEAVLADRVRVLGSDHPDTLMSRGNLASA
jgi:tetratricopeptide (TPR) repeat protein